MLSRTFGNVLQPKYTIRLADKQDIININHCNRKNLPENYSLMFYDDHLRRWPDLSIVAETNDKKLMGYALARVELQAPSNSFIGLYEKSTYLGHVTSIALDEEFRGMGVAKRLMQQLHAHLARNYQVDSANLYCRVTNDAAVGLYTGEDLGYIQDRRVEKYYMDGEDAWFMTADGLIQKYCANARSDTNVDAVDIAVGYGVNKGRDCQVGTVKEKEKEQGGAASEVVIQQQRARSLSTGQVQSMLLDSGLGQSSQFQQQQQQQQQNQHQQREQQQEQLQKGMDVIDAIISGSATSDTGTYMKQ